MKYIFYIFIYLNIYTAFFCESYSQKLYLKIETNEPSKDSVLESINYQREFKNLKELSIEIDSVKSTLNRKGYIENNILPLKKDSDSSYISTFKVGVKYNNIKIYYNSNDFSEEELLKISSSITDRHFTIPFSTIEKSLQKLKSIKSENGNPFLKIQLTNISKEENQTLSAHLNIKKGLKRTIDKIVIKGYEKFPRPYLRYYAGIKTEKLFKQNEISQQNETLNNLRFVETIKPPEVLFEKDSTTIYYYLKKQNNNLFDGILGFATNEESNEIIFNGYLNLELNNNLNAGERLTINYKADGKEQQNFNAKVDIPYLFNSPFGLGLGLTIFKRDSTFLTTEQFVKTTYQINPKFKSYIGYKSKESTNLLDDDSTIQDLEDYNSQYFIVGGSYAVYQNSSLSPLKSFIEINSEFGNREISNLKEQQSLISLNLHHIFNLNYKNSIFLKSLNNILNSDRYLQNELFRFGGINSIRGFNENSIEATFLTTFNTEYRYLISDAFYIHSIIDFGYFENQSISIKEKLYSLGFGIGMNTRAGIFKFNVANGNLSNQNFNFSNTKIHLSLTSQF